MPSRHVAPWFCSTLRARRAPNYQIQGQALADVLQSVRDLPNAPLVSLDLNGVSPGPDAAARHSTILGPALKHVDILHANLEEAEAIVGPPQPAAAAGGEGDAAAPSEERLRTLAQWFLEKGVAIVTITLGGQGSYTAVTSDESRVNAVGSLRRQAGAWVGQELRAAAYAAGEGSSINANGAGDSFVGGLVLATSAWKERLELKEAVEFAGLAALQRVDGKLRAAAVKKKATELMMAVKGRGGQALPPTLPLS